MSTALDPGDLMVSPREPFYRQAAGLMWFTSLLMLMAISVDLGPISWLGYKLRWVTLGVLCCAGLAAWPRLRRVGITPEHRWLLVLSTISLFACAYSYIPIYSFERWVSLAMLLIAVFIGAWTTLQREDAIRTAVDALFWIVVIVSVVTVFQTTQEGIFGRDDRATGAFDKATGAGGFAAVALPIVLWKLRYTRDWTRYLGWIALAAQGYVLVFSGSRGALGAMVMSLPVIFWAQFPRLRGMMIVCIVLAGLLTAGGVLGLSVLPDYVTRTDTISTMTGRLGRFKALLVVWEKQPILGHGYGISRFMIVRDSDALDVYLGDDQSSRSAQYLLSANLQNKPAVVHSHSDHIERLVETGIIGYLPFAAFWIVLLARIPRALKRPVSPLNDLIRCLLAAIWFAFIDSHLHSGMFAVGNGATVLIWFVIVLLISADALARRQQRLVSAPKAAIPVTPGGWAVASP